MKLKEKKLHDYVDKNIDLLVDAWADQYNMILLNPLTSSPNGSFTRSEKIWKNSQNEDMWYSETEIKEYIADMDTVEIENLIEYQKGL